MILLNNNVTDINKHQCYLVKFKNHYDNISNQFHEIKFLQHAHIRTKLSMHQFHFVIFLCNIMKNSTAYILFEFQLF